MGRDAAGQQGTDGGVRAFLFPVFFLLAGLLAIGALQYQPRDNEPVAMVFPPWFAERDSMMAVAAAGGALRHFAAAPWIIVATLPPRQTIARAHAAGAWLVLAATPAGLCRNRTPAQ
jgi:hypothetical protein